MKILTYKKVIPAGILLSVMITAAVLIARAFSAPTAKSMVTIEATEGGTIPAGLTDTISGSYDAGTRIRLITRCNPGYTFDRWVSSDGKNHFEDASLADTLFIYRKKMLQ